MSNAEMNAEPELEQEMQGGEAQVNSEEIEIEQMANLKGGKRRKSRSKKSRKSIKSKKSKTAKKQRKSKRGGSYKNGVVGTAAAPLLLLGMQQVMAKKLRKNKKSKKNTRSRKH